MFSTASPQPSPEPQSGVPFTAIVGGAVSGTPENLVKTLAMSVSANED